MRKIIILFIILTVSLYCSTEEKETESKPQEITEITSKLVEMDARIGKMSEEIKKMQEEIEKIKESVKLLSYTIRDLQIYTQGGATIKPDEDAWNDIKRGMSVEDVEKLLGTPEEIEVQRTGGEVWYYYGLGSISFDRNGRVISQKTFKQLPLERKVR
ncbi:MAG: hypothetical protein NC932_03520 [Candidatus Omnitrophica bacterium]|nr:hypothetical protein [Candidatus Omnitrophota bacterium]